jgi:hypothetical protein
MGIAFIAYNWKILWNILLEFLFFLGKNPFEMLKQTYYASFKTSGS